MSGDRKWCHLGSTSCIMVYHENLI